MIKAKAMIKAKVMIKAIPPLPLRSLVGVTKSSQELSKISPNVLVCFLLGIGAPSPPVRENIPFYKKMAQVKVLHMLLFPAERHMKGLLTV